MSPSEDVRKSVVQISTHDQVKQRIDDNRAERAKNCPSVNQSVRPYNVFQTKIPKLTSTEKKPVIEAK